MYKHLRSFSFYTTDAQIEELSKYSRYVKFASKVRAIFLSEFQKYKHLFPGVNGEAMFIGTVLHSLDHTLMDWNLEVRRKLLPLCCTSKAIKKTIFFGDGS